MAVSKPVIQQRLPFVDPQGRLSNEGTRALNDAFKGIYDQINQIAELYQLTSDLGAGIFLINDATVLLQSASTAFADGVVVSDGDAISFATAPGSLVINFNGTTDDVPEDTNLYFTTARARNSLSAGTGLAYNPFTGVVSAVPVLAAYAGGDTPSAFVLSLVDSADGVAFRGAIGIGPAGTQDYQEGNWTPTLNNFTGALASSACYYTKIGSQVHVWGILVPVTTFATTVGLSNVSGLPFNPVTDGPVVAWSKGYEGQPSSIIVSNGLYAPTIAATSSNLYFSCTYTV